MYNYSHDKKEKPSQGHRVFKYKKNIYTRQKEIDLRVYHL